MCRYRGARLLTADQGGRMPSATWVVYAIPTRDCPGGVRAVCDDREWAALDGARPGFYTLVQGGIAHEGEAERLARGTSGESRPRNVRVAPHSWPDETAVVPAGPAG